MASKTGPTPILVTLFLILVVGVAPAVADDIYVDGAGAGENYTTIQEAVNAANAGDTILVYNGTYTENIDVNKTVTIEAVSTGLVTPTTVGDSEYTIVPPPETTETVIEAANSEYSVFNVTSNGVTISGFIITGATGVGSAGICLLSDENEISNNLIVGNYYGIYMNESEENNIFNNTVAENEKDGIFFDLSDSNIIENNTVIYNSYRGIFGLNSDNTELTNNEVTGNYDYYYSPEPVMEEPETFSESESESKTCDKKNSESSELFGSEEDSRKVEKGAGPVKEFLAKIYAVVVSDEETSEHISKGETKEHSNSKTLMESLEILTSTGEEDYRGCLYTSDPEIGIYLLDCSDSVLTGNTVTYFDTSGIFTEGNRNTLTGNTVNYNSWAGIRMVGDDNYLADNVVTDNGECGIHLGKYDWYNYVLYESNGNTLVNNTVEYNSGSGIHISGSDNTLVDNNLIDNYGAGIRLGFINWEYSFVYESDNNVIEGNTISGNEAGIRIDGSGQEISDNTVVDNDDTGIRLGSVDSHSFSSGNVLSGNNVSFNGRNGIRIDGSDNTLTDNDVIDNSDKGIFIGQYYYGYPTADNVLSGNNVSLNGDHGIRIDGSNNTLTYNTVIDNSDRGIWMGSCQDSDIGPKQSNYNELVGNEVSLNGENGIHMFGSHNTFTENIINSNDDHGIRINGDYNTFTENIINDSDDQGIFFNGNYNTLTGNAINNSYYDNGLRFIGNNNTLTGNSVSFSDDNGIRADGYYNTFTDNTVSFNQEHGIKIEGEYNTFTGNTVFSNGYGYYDDYYDEYHDYDRHGIQIDGSHNILTANNVSNNSWCGIRITYGTDNTFEDNILNDNEFAGIRIGDDFYSGYLEVFKAAGLYDAASTGNSFVNNTLISNGYFGIFLSYSGGDVLEDNYVASNGFNEEVSPYCEWPNVGICLISFHDGTVKGNTLVNNSYAGLFMEGSSENTVYDNYFNNTENVELGNLNPDNLWNIEKTEGTNVVGGPYLGGNFWALPDGTGFSQNTTDADEDGICDLPYNVTEDEENIDYFPLAVAPEVEDEDDDDSSGSGGTGGIGSSGGGSSTYIPASTTGVTGEVETAQKKVVQGRETKLQFNNPKNGVSGIGFTSKKYSGVVIVRVEGTDGAEASGKPDGKVQRYMRILVGNEKFEGSDNIDEGIIEFRVPKSWLEENGIDPSEVALNRYHDGAWTSLPTEMTGEDDEYYYFTAKTPGFSLYAITGGDNETGAAGGNDVITPTEEEEEENEAITGEEQTKEEESEKESAPGFESALAVLGILGSAFFVRREMLK